VNIQLANWKRLTDDAERPRLSSRDEGITAILSGVTVLGLYLDGWAHINLLQGKLGAFLTPWHGVLYAGFTATALWIITRNQRLRGRTWSVDNVPAGYGLSIIGLMISGLAVAGDAIWHTLFGVEEGVARVLAPFHLALFTGAALVIAAPFRAAWTADCHSPTSTTRCLLPAAVSLTLTTAVAAFVLQFVSPFIVWTAPQVSRLAANTPFAELAQVNALVGLVLTSLIFVVPILLVHRRLRPPVGTMAFLLTTVAILTSAMNQFRFGALILAPAVSGLATDLLLHTLEGRTRLHVHRVVGAFIPGTVCGTYLLLEGLVYGSVWSPELTLSALALAVLGGVVLSVLSLPPARASGAVPLHDTERRVDGDRLAA
jgi:hypothetical protein